MHGDLHPGNVVFWTGPVQARVVDLEACRRAASSQQLEDEREELETLLKEPVEDSS